MRVLWRHRPSPAIVLACLALAVALGGTGYAAIALPANSVGTAQLRNNAVTSIKVQNGSLLKADFKAGQIPTGATGPAGPAGPAGAAGPAGPFPASLPAGKTINGAFNIGGTAVAAGGLANTSISFIWPFTTLPTVQIVLQGTTPPAACPGNANSPAAQIGFLCIYEDSHVNTTGVTLNAVQRFGATIYINSTAPGTFYSFGSWAATGD